MALNEMLHDSRLQWIPPTPFVTTGGSTEMDDATRHAGPSRQPKDIARKKLQMDMNHIIPGGQSGEPPRKNRINRAMNHSAAYLAKILVEISWEICQSSNIDCKLFSIRFSEHIQSSHFRAATIQTPKNLKNPDQSKNLQERRL
jgi:hypothetical protein